MGKTTAKQECAHVVKHGIRLLLLGIPPKLFLYFNKFLLNIFVNIFQFFIIRKKWHLFSPTTSANGVFSPDKLRCVPVRVGGAGSGNRFRKVPESSGVK